MSDATPPPGDPAPIQPDGHVLNLWIALVVGLTLVTPVLLIYTINPAAIGRALAYLASRFAQPWSFPARPLLGLLCGGGLALGTWGLGYGLIRAIAPWRRMLPRLAQQATLAPLAGALPLSLFILGLGLADLWIKGVFLALLAVLTLTGLTALLDALRHARHARGIGHRPHDLRRLWPMLAALSVVCLVSIPYALTPAVESDELRYHLAAPSTWLRMGGIHYLPWQAFSNFPMLSEMLFSAGLATGGAAAAKLIHLAMLAAVMGLTALIALEALPHLTNPAGRRERLSHPLAASTAFALIPSVPILAAWGFVDMFMAAYFLGFVYLAGRALARPRRASGSLVGWITAGAIGVKYTMLPLLGILGILWVAMGWLRRRPGDGSRLPMRAVAATALTAAALGSPWFIKNLVWTGNPFYPLAYSIFGGGQWSEANAAFYMSKAAGKGMHLAWPSGPAGRLAEFLITPVTTTFYPGRFEDHYFGPFPLMALCVLLGGWLALRLAPQPLRQTLAMRCPRQGVWLGLALLVSWAFWFMTYQSNRLLLPSIGLLLALAAGFAPRLTRPARPHVPIIFNALYGLALTFSAVIYVTFMGIPDPAPRSAAKADAVALGLGFGNRDVYLDRKLAYWLPAQQLARLVKPGEKVLLVGEHRTMYFDMDVIASDWYDTPQPLPWIRATPGNAAMMDRLYAEGVRYVFFNFGELSRYAPGILPLVFDMQGRTPPTDDGKLFRDRFTPAEYARFEAFIRDPRLREIRRDIQHGVIIYRLDDSYGKP